MQVYAIRFFNFLRFGEKNNSLVLDLTDEQKQGLMDETLTMDQIYNEVAKDPLKHVREVKARGIEKLLGISGIIDGNEKSSNGAGKSSVMEGVTYAHYGKVVRLSANTDRTGEAGMSVVTRINGQISDKVKEFWVEEYFESNGILYRVKRGRAFSKTKKTSSPIMEFEQILEIGVDPESGHRSGDTKKSIDEVNDMPYDLFVSSQMFGQNDAGKFLTGTDKTKKEMIISMLKMDSIVSKYLKLTRDKKSSAEKDVLAKTEKIALLERQVFKTFKSYIPNSEILSYTPSIIKEFNLVTSQKLEDLKIDNYSEGKELVELGNKIGDLAKSNVITIVEDIKKEGIKVKSDYDGKKKMLDDQVAVWKSMLDETVKDSLSKKNQIDVLNLKIEKTEKESQKLSGEIKSFNVDIHNSAIEKAGKAKTAKSKYEALKKELESQKYKIIEEESSKKSNILSIESLIKKYNGQKSKVNQNGQLICIECGSEVGLDHILLKIKQEEDKLPVLLNERTTIELSKKENQNKLDDANSKLQKISDFISEEPKSIMAINTHNGNVKSEKDLVLKIAEFKKEIDTLKFALNELAVRKMEYEGKISEITNRHEKEIKEIEVKLNELRDKMQLAKTDALSVTEKIKELTLKKKEIEEKIAKNNEMIGFTKNEIESFKSNVLLIAEEEASKAISAKQLYHYQTLEGVLGLDGIQTRIVKKYLPLLNTYVKEYIDILSFGMLQIEMTINQKSEVDLRIYGGTSDVYEMLSGGERMIVRLAVDIGLAIFAFSRSVKNPEIICLDEIFGSLDEANTSSVFRMLQHLQNKFNRIILITHNSEIKKLIRNNIIVEKNGGLNAASEIKRIE